MLMSETKEKMTEKHFATIHISDYFGSPPKHIEYEIEKGTKPTIGTFMDLFKKHFNVDTVITDLSLLEFKVVNPIPKGIRVLRVIRDVPEHMYYPTTKNNYRFGESRF